MWSRGPRQSRPPPDCHVAPFGHRPQGRLAMTGHCQIQKVGPKSLGSELRKMFETSLPFCTKFPSWRTKGMLKVTLPSEIILFPRRGRAYDPMGPWEGAFWGRAVSGQQSADSGTKYADSNNQEPRDKNQTMTITRREKARSKNIETRNNRPCPFAAGAMKDENVAP